MKLRVIQGLLSALSVLLPGLPTEKRKKEREKKGQNVTYLLLQIGFKAQNICFRSELSYGRSNTVF